MRENKENKMTEEEFEKLKEKYKDKNILDIYEITEITGLSTDERRELESEDKFPYKVRVGPAVGARWYKSQIFKWLENEIKGIEQEWF